MKKLLLILFITILLPQVAFASWWNPVTWNWPWGKQVKIEGQTQRPVYVTPTPKEMKRKENLIEKKILITLPVKNEEKKTPALIKPIMSVVKDPPELFISNISVDTETHSVRVSWETNILSESKVFLDGKTYFSKRGVETLHYIDIGDLESDLYHAGTITAITNGAWKNQNFNFTTKEEPPKFEPKVILNKESIKNDGSDRIKIKIKTIDSNGGVVPNKKIEIITSTGPEQEYKTRTLISDKNGNATYNTPTTKVVGAGCGASMSISIKIDGDYSYSKQIPIENTIKNTHSGGFLRGGTFACA